VRELEGATVTADAGNGTRAVARAVRQAGADYVLRLRGNRRALHKRVRALLEGPGPRLAARSFVACSRGTPPLALSPYPSTSLISSTPKQHTNYWAIKATERGRRKARGRTSAGADFVARSACLMPATLAR
jgi:hypothetical protein